MLCRRRDCVAGDDQGWRIEELAAQILQSTQRSRRHRHPAPASALAIEDGERERHAGPLARKPSHHLRPPPRLAEGALDQVGVPAAPPVLGREAEVDAQALGVLGEACDRSWVGALPLAREAVEAPASLSDGPLARRLLDVVEDLPPVGFEGVLVGLGHLGDGVAQSVNDTALSERAGKHLLDRRDELRRPVGDDEERVAQAGRLAGWPGQ